MVTDGGRDYELTAAENGVAIRLGRQRPYFVSWGDAIRIASAVVKAYKETANGSSRAEADDPPEDDEPRWSCGDCVRKDMTLSEASLHHRRTDHAIVKQREP